MVCLLMAYPTLSQNTSKIEPRVQTTVNSKGDTLVTMTLADAKIVLSDLYNKQISDSLIEIYVSREKIHTSTISLLKTDVDLYIKKCNNLNIIINNDTKIIDNKDTEIALLNETINTQKKEIIKQKVLKIMGFTAAVVLPITTILLMAR
jgi:hypothetical protein